LLQYGPARKATDGETWFERQSGLRYSARLIHLPEKSQRGGEMKMRAGQITIGLDSPT
jgi:hypothetical protein